jgi:hypothetical protein
MAAPALIYVAFNTGGEGLAGWAIPTATDIAFALAVLAVIGTHLPAALRTFLLTLAVVDDLLAITIIALFYSGSLHLLPLALAVLPLALFALLVQRRVRSWWLLLPLAAATWVLVHESGVHATVAGVLLGFTVPVIRRRPGPGPGLAEHFEHRFRPLSAGVAVPVFAFFAAGVTVVGTDRFGTSLTDSITLGIVVALVVGKTIGVLGSTWLVQRFTHAQLAEGSAGGTSSASRCSAASGSPSRCSSASSRSVPGPRRTTRSRSACCSVRCFRRSSPRSSSASATASTAGLRPRRNTTSTGPATGGAQRAGVRLHAEPGATEGLDGVGRAVDVDLCRATAAEQVEQQLARRSRDVGGGFAAPRPDGLAGPRPPELESYAPQPSGEEPGRLADVAPQRLIQGGLGGSRTTTVGSADVLVVDEELVEVGVPAYPADPEEAGRRSGSDRLDEPGEVPRRERPASSFGQPTPRARQDESGCGEAVVLADDQVRGKITGRPRAQQGGRLGTELVEQVAELCALDGLEGRIGHGARA